METFFAQHFELAPTMIYGLILVVCWFMIRTIKKIDANQSKLFDMYGALDRRLSTLQGAHDAIITLDNGHGRK